MRDPARQRPLIERLYDVWHHFPDWRLGQLMFNLTGQFDVFYVEDEVLSDALEAVRAGTHPTVRIPS